MTTGGLLNQITTFLTGLPNPTTPPPNAVSATWNIVPFVTTKSIDIQRAGDVVTVGAPHSSGHVMGLGFGQAHGEYSMQQITEYTFTLGMYAWAEVDIESATDWIAQNIVPHFLNLQYSEGLIILAKVLDFGEILNERGIWERKLRVMIECIIGP